jgi:hypothetical protein
MESEKTDRREFMDDLQLAKEYLREMYEQLAPFLQTDELKNKAAGLIYKDLDKIQSALDLKTVFDQLKDAHPQAEQRMTLENRQKLDLARSAIDRYLNKLETKI